MTSFTLKLYQENDIIYFKSGERIIGEKICSKSFAAGLLGY